MVNTENFILLLMILTRLSCFLVTTPFFSTRSIPNLIKLGIVGLLSFFVYGFPIHQTALIVIQSETWVETILMECLIGLLLGTGTTLIFLAIQGAGDLVDTVAGLKMSSTYDPLSGNNSTLYSNFYNWVGLILFLIMEGHHYLLRGIVNSFIFVPIGAIQHIEWSLGQLIDLLRQHFIITLQLAIPIAVLLFFIDILLGVISKAIPQINVFILGMPLKLVISFYVFMTVVNSLLSSMGGAIESVLEGLNQLIQSLF